MKQLTLVSLPSRSGRLIRFEDEAGNLYASRHDATVGIAIERATTLGGDRRPRRTVEYADGRTITHVLTASGRWDIEAVKCLGLESTDPYRRPVTTYLGRTRMHSCGRTFTYPVNEPTDRPTITLS